MNRRDFLKGLSVTIASLSVPVVIDDILSKFNGYTYCEGVDPLTGIFGGVYLRDPESKIRVLGTKDPYSDYWLYSKNVGVDWEFLNDDEFVCRIGTVELFIKLSEYPPEVDTRKFHTVCRR